MAQDFQPRIPAAANAAQPAAAPTAREMRVQSMHRLQMGLFGLCAMLLLVGLANIIMDRARLAEQDDPGIETVEPTATAKAANDPLADIGVVPAADPSIAPSPGMGR